MMHLILAIQHWLAVHTGTYIPAGQYSVYYNFWSGFGSDLAEFGIIVGLVRIYVNSRCHEDKCHKHGKYPFQHYKLCAIHHPDVPKNVTHLSIMKLHKKAQDEDRT